MRKPVSDKQFIAAVKTSFSVQADELSTSFEIARLSDESRISESSNFDRNPRGDDRQKVIALLRATQFRLKQTQVSLDHAPEGVYWVNENAEIIYTNHWNCKLLGYKQQHLLSKTLVELIPRIQSIEHFKQNILPQIKSTGLKSEEQHLRSDGTLVQVELSARDIDYEGEKIICVYVRDITDRKRKETELLKAKALAEEGEKRFRALANSASPLMWTTELDSTCSWLNNRWLEYTGKTLEDQIGYGWLDSVHVDDQDPTKTSYLNAFEKQTDFEVEYRLRRYDGEYRWFRVNATARKDPNDRFVGFVGMSFDIHESRNYVTQLEESRVALREANSSLEALFDLLGTSDGVWDWKVGTEEVNYAPGFRKLLGFDGDDHEAFPNKLVSLESRIHPEDYEAFWSCIHECFNNKLAFAMEFRMRSKNDNYFWVRSRGMASFDNNGKAERLVGSTYDISDIKNVELKLQKERQALARSNSDLSQFAYVASHDLQEPLRAIGGFLQLIELKYKNQLDELGQGYIEKSVAGAARMSQLINDLLLFSRVTKTDADFEEVNLNDVATEAMEELEQAISQSRASISIGDLPSLNGARPLLGQLFRNLIGNAIKYRGDSDPVIEISSQTSKNGTHVLKFQDNGIGIAAEHTDQVFELFKRLHHRSEHPGTGIGLAICKRVAERHGGDIEVEKNDQPGTCFLVTLRS